MKYEDIIEALSKQYSVYHKLETARGGDLAKIEDRLKEISNHPSLATYKEYLELIRQRDELNDTLPLIRGHVAGLHEAREIVMDIAFAKDSEGGQ